MIGRGFRLILCQTVSWPTIHRVFNKYNNDRVNECIIDGRNAWSIRLVLRNSNIRKIQTRFDQILSPLWSVVLLIRRYWMHYYSAIRFECVTSTRRGAGDYLNYEYLFSSGVCVISTIRIRLNGNLAALSRYAKRRNLRSPFDGVAVNR